MRRQHVVDLVSKTIRRIVPDAIVTLYGSEARGEARRDSDMDLLVQLPMEYGREFLAKQRELTEALLFDVELKTGVPMSPYVVTKQWWERHPQTQFTLNIKNDGIRI